MPMRHATQSIREMSRTVQGGALTFFGSRRGPILGEAGDSFVSINDVDLQTTPLPAEFVASLSLV